MIPKGLKLSEHVAVHFILSAFWVRKLKINNSYGTHICIYPGLKGVDMCLGFLHKLMYTYYLCSIQWVLFIIIVLKTMFCFGNNILTLFGII